MELFLPFFDAITHRFIVLRLFLHELPHAIYLLFLYLLNHGRVGLELLDALLSAHLPVKGLSQLFNLFFESSGP